MRKVTRKRFIAVICWFVAINLSLAPVVHASIIMFDGTDHQSASIGHNCDQEITDLKGSSTHQHDGHMKGAAKMDSEHGNGTTCKLLCSVSVSVLNQGNISTFGFEKSIRWLLIDTPALNPSFLSRLERPPKP
jgi:hypothetical protein